MKFIRIISFFAVAATLSLTTGCNGCQNKKTPDVSQIADSSNVMSVDQVVAGLDEGVDKPIKVEGVCTHICKHGGKKIFLMGTDDTKTIRVEASASLGSFKQEVVNSIVEVEGILREQRIDEAYLTAWQESLRTNTAEQHGDGEAGCGSEQKARGETQASGEQERIDNFRARIAQRKASEGKEYLSFYYVDASGYTIE